MIEVKNAVKKFDDFIAIDNLNLTVEDSSVYGLVGYNGAGKTTLLKMIADAYTPTSGSILIDGENVRDNARIKKTMFYVPDDLFFLPFTNIKKMAKFYEGFYPNFNMRVMYNLCEAFGLDPKKRISGFSKGMQRQAEMIFALASNPKILLLDESFDGLDPEKRAAVKKILLEYMADNGATVIISSHNLHELTGLCDRIGLMDGKKLALDCSVDEMSGSRCGYRLVFTEPKAEAEFEHIEHTAFKCEGNLVTFTASGNLDEADEKLRAMSPVMMERIPLSLEEIFLQEMEGKEYDYSKIFVK